MSYDVAVWEGRRPTDDEAGEVFEQVMDDDEARAESGAAAEPLTPTISAFLGDLLQRWPDIDEPGGENSPWAMSGLRDDASGGTCYLTMSVTPVLDEARSGLAPQPAVGSASHAASSLARSGAPSSLICRCRST